MNLSKQHTEQSNDILKGVNALFAAIFESASDAGINPSNVFPPTPYEESIFVTRRITDGRLELECDDDRLQHDGL